MLYHIDLRVVVEKGSPAQLTTDLVIDSRMLDLAIDPEGVACQQFREAFRRLRALEVESRSWSEEDWDSRARRQWLDPDKRRK